MKKLINGGILMFALLAFLLSGNLNAQEWSKEQKSVWEVVEKGWASWKSGDTDGTFKGIHENYLGWNNTDPLPMSKEKWMSSYDEWKDYMKVEYYDLSPARILVEGDNAVVYYYFEFSSVFEKGEKRKENHIKGRNVEFYVKDGSKWMLFGDMTYFKAKDK